VASFLIRKYCLRLIEDTGQFEYDLRNREGPLVRVFRMEDENFEEVQKRMLVNLNQKLDIFRIEGQVLFGVRGDAIYQDPKEIASLMEATNIYSMVIEGLPKDWLPMATPRAMISPMIADLQFRYDRERMAPFISYMDRDIVCPNNHLVLGTFKKDVGVPSLLVLCLRRLSSYNLAYGGTVEYPYVSNACFNPLLGLTDKLSRLPKNYVSFLPDFNFNDVHRALNFYYSYCVKVQKFKFEFKPSDLDKFKYNVAKCGFRDWPEMPDFQLDPYTKVKFTTRPNKKQSQALLIKEMLKSYFLAMDEVQAGIVPFEKHLKAFITTLSIKEQNISPIDLGDLQDVTVSEMFHKSRLFFLSNDSMLHKFFQTRVKGERTYFPECTDIYGKRAAKNMTVNISIGFTWTRGGAFLLHNALHGERMDKYERVSFPGDSKDNVCCTYKFVSSGDMLVASGDIKSLDTSITAIPLVLYLMFAQIWVQRNDEDPHYRTFQYILESCAEQLAGKTVRWLKDFVLLIGVMPSGSLETSHGDSWIVGIVYWLSYVFNVMAKVQPKIRKVIWTYLSRRLIALAVYGDDFLKIYPKNLRNFINIEGFVQYLWVCHGIRMKNSEEFTCMLTYMTVRNNEVLNYVHTGPTYLKRHFIDSSNFNLELHQPKISKIVSWRPLPQYFWRAGVPRDRSAPIYINLARLIGLAYDTLGIDPVAYNYIRLIYKWSFEQSAKIVGPDYLLRNIPIWLQEDVKYLRKINFQITHSNFPTREELLSLNILDRAYHLPKNVGTWQDHLTDETWW